MSVIYQRILKTYLLYAKLTIIWYNHQNELFLSLQWSNKILVCKLFH